MQQRLDPPFGTYALPPRLERLRRSAEAMPARWMTSGIRRLLCALRPGPFDVTVFGDQKARLHPADNKAERRVFSGSQFWDPQERDALDHAVAESDGTFVFVDVGANAGMYTLWVRARAGAHGRQATILAVEPDPVNADRLRANLAANGATGVRHLAKVLSDAPGTVRFVSGGLRNRGAARVGEGDLELSATTLVAALGEAGIDRIDALKIDVEGHEVQVLAPFFQDAPRSLLPRLILTEVNHDDGGLRALIGRAGYRLAADHGLNALFALGTAQNGNDHGEA